MSLWLHVKTSRSHSAHQILLHLPSLQSFLPAGWVCSKEVGGHGGQHGC
jgi:hypothetical protein